MNKKEILQMVQNARNTYVIMSKCTAMPYVACSPETYDDEVFVFYSEEEAMKEAKKLSEAKNPVYIAKVERKQLLLFYTSLFPMGVNCVTLDDGNDGKLKVQLKDLIRRPQEDMIPAGKERVENPEFHLTALYIMQEVRRGMGPDMEKLKEMNEELMVHFQEGRYLVPVGKDNKAPLLKQKDGKIYQAVFTDFPEFQKFNREGQFKPAVADAGDIYKILLPETSGVAVNPMGMNLLMNIESNQKTG